ncbi:MAG: acetyl-CoA C-acyltransferase [Chloroflexi bacterium]|nr:MAG: acetyl-CoA C-acyltransferase [Chloroflexota bacterium]
MAQPEIVVLSGVRTAIGTYGGSLKGKHATELGAAVVREAVKRATIKPEEVGHVVFGSAIPTDTHDIYLARVAAVNGGLLVKTPAFTLNRLCGSGLQAVVSAAQLIAMGDASVTVAGGAEVMSSGPYWDSATRWGQRLGDTKLIDSVLGGLTDPFGNGHMGVTAENVAEKYNISREAQDELALQSNQRAAAAIKAGYFKEQILPIEYTVKGKTMVFDTDEHVKPNTTMEILAKLPPAFKANGTVTAGNASGMNDAAAAVVLMDASEAQQRGLQPLGRLVGYAFAGVEPKYMGVGPIPAVKKVMERTGLTVQDMDTIELNEAFASQAIEVIRELDLPMERTNPNGSGISLGHPVGATGCILVVKALYELRRTGGKYALVTLCIGGGQGIAAIFEAM